MLLHEYNTSFKGIWSKGSETVNVPLVTLPVNLPSIKAMNL